MKEVIYTVMDDVPGYVDKDGKPLKKGDRFSAVIVATIAGDIPKVKLENKTKIV